MLAKGLLRRHAVAIGLIQKVLDVAGIVLLLFASQTFYGYDWSEPGTVTSAFSAVAFFLFFANLFVLYRSWRVHSIWEEFEVLVYTLIGMVLGLLLLAYATRTTANFSLLSIGTWWVSLPVYFLFFRAAIRALLKYFRSQGFNTQTIAILGTGKAAQELAREIQKNEWMGLKIDGYYDDRKTLREVVQDAPDVLIKGPFEDLILRAKQHKFDAVYVALPMKAESVMNRVIMELADCSIPVHIVPDLFTFQLLNARTSNIGNIPIVSVYESPLDDFGAIMKRTLDLVGSLLILAIIAIPMLVIALAIKLTSKGPVLFRQRRYGIRGEVIEVWKFRSMTVMDNGDNVPQAKKDDARITPLGACLRRTSLDELPQFLNVLQGSMSIVGPRPHAVVHNEMYRKIIDGYMLRHMVKPGITGWAQVNGWRGETDTEEKMKKRIEYDLEYLRNWTILLDIKIILLTVLRGFNNKNAY